MINCNRYKERGIKIQSEWQGLCVKRLILKQTGWDRMVIDQEVGTELGSRVLTEWDSATSRFEKNRSQQNVTV